jgi:hypothetical protein
MQPVQPGLRPSDLFGDFWGFLKEVHASEEWMQTRPGQRIVQRELDRMTEHLQRFDAEGLPEPSTRLWSQPLRAEVDAPWYVRPPEQVQNELGRHYDPALYAQLDKLDAGIAEAKARADQLRAIQTEPRSVAADAQLNKVQDIEQQIEALRQQQQGADRRKMKRLDREMQQLNKQQREILTAVQSDAQRLSDAQLEAVSISKRLTELQHLRQQLTPLQRHAEEVARGVMDQNMPPVEALIMMDRLVAYGVDIAPPISRNREGISQLHGELQPAMQHLTSESPVNHSAKPGELPAETVVRTTREAADQADDGEVLAQRIRESLADTERTEPRIGDAAYPVDEKGVRQAGAVTVLDLVEKDGERFARVRQEDGKESFWPVDRLERIPTIDLGRGPMRLDQEIAVGVGEDGQPRTMKVRDIIKEIDDDEAMLRAMTTCARE